MCRPLLSILPCVAWFATSLSAQCSFTFPIEVVFEPEELQPNFDRRGATGGAPAPASGAAGPRSGRAGPASPGPSTGSPASPGRGGGGGAPFTGMPRQDWKAWWVWNRDEFLKPHSRDAWIRGDQFRSPGDAVRLHAIASECLDSSSAAVRAAATLALGRSRGEDVVERLVARFDDPHVGVRHTAILALGHAGTARARRELMRLAAQPVRSAERVSHVSAPYAILGLALARLNGAPAHTDGFVAALPELVRGEERDRVLLACLMYQQLVPNRALERVAEQVAQDRDVPRSVRCRAIEALAAAATMDPSRVGALARMRKERDLATRYSAAFALGQCDGTPAFESLVDGLGTEREQLAQAFGLLAVGQTDTADALAFLTNEVENGRKTNRAWAAMALGLWARDRSLVDRENAREVIRAGLNRERNRDAHGAYLLGLGLARAERESDFLLETLAKSPNVTSRASAAEAIHLIDAPGARTALRASFDTAKGRDTRAVLAKLLGYYAHPDDEQAVLAEFRATLPEYRGVIARGLANFRSPAAFAALEDVVLDDDGIDLVRATALRALGNMVGGHRSHQLARLAANGNYLAFPEWLCVPVKSGL